MALKILAISSSRVGNSGYLEEAAPMIENFLGKSQLNIAFIPFASVDSYGDYLQKVRDGLSNLPYKIDVANEVNGKEVIEKCDVIMVGGGNTFKLLHHLYQFNFLNLIKLKIQNGTPYIGWSAGANLTGRSISTTNDMPIIEPKSFAAFGFFPFQINPHYHNVKPEGFNGETRDQRLEEFIKMNPAVSIVALPEGTALKLENEELKLIGNCGGVVFSFDNKTNKMVQRAVEIDEDISVLL